MWKCIVRVYNEAVLIFNWTFAAGASAEIFYEIISDFSAHSVIKFLTK